MTERIYTIEHTGRFTDGKITDEYVVVSMRKERYNGAYDTENIHIPIKDWKQFKALLENFAPKKIQHESPIS